MKFQPVNNKNQCRINEAIRSRQVRVILADGQQLGVISTVDALKRAKEAGLDLVEIVPNSNPPVCKILDFGKYRYEQSKKTKEAKKSQSVITKTVKFTPTTGEGDLVRKAEDIKKFIEKGFQVVVMIEMKGRQNAHPDVAFKQMEKIQEVVGVPPSDRPKRQDGKITATFKPAE